MAEIGALAGYKLLPELMERQSGNVADKKMSGELGVGNSPQGVTQGAGSQNFLDTLKGALGEVNEMQVQADKAAQDFSTGQGTNLHDVLIAMEKADVALRTVTSLRNKMVEAYQEIMRMPV